MSGQPTHADLQSDINRIRTERDADDRLRAEHRAEQMDQIRMIRQQLGQIYQLIENVEAKTERIEAKVLAYDLLRARIVGWVAGWAVGIAGLWFLIKDKVATFFGVTS